MFRPRVAAASLSGVSDAEWARGAAPRVGAAFLGGVSLDEPTREGSRRLAERDREAFLPEDPVAWIDRQLDALDDCPLLAGVNVRSTTPEPIARAAAVCADRDAVLEVNAHCRQPELCDAGAGQTLLREPSRLAELVRAAAEPASAVHAGRDAPPATDAPLVSVKLRTEVAGVDLPAVARRCERAGADVLHVDAMDSESVVADVADATDAFLIANNEVRDRESVAEYLEYGADAVSVGRPSTEPALLERVRAAADELLAAEQSPP